MSEIGRNRTSIGRLFSRRNRARSSSPGLAAPAGRPWDVNPDSRELLIDGRRTRLSEKPFRVLMALLERPGEVVSRDDLRRRLWPDDTFVDFDNNLNTAVASLRQALGDSARAPRYIETLPRLGYRLLPVASLPADAAPGRGYGIGAVAIAAAVVLIVLASALVLWPRPGASPAADGVATSAEAADAFARGRYLREQFMTTFDADALRQARRAFREAAALDPAFAKAIAEEADTAVEMAFAGAMRFRDGLQEARDLAGQALALDDGTAAAHRVMAMTRLFLDWDVEAARLHVARSEELDATMARTAMARATFASALGLHDEAIEAARRAVALEPEAYYVRADLAFFYLAAGRDREAAASSQTVLDVRPDFLPALVYAATAYERLGLWGDAAAAARGVMAQMGATAGDLARFDASRARDAVRFWRQWDLGRMQRMADGRTADYAFQLALKHAAAGNHATALDFLERAFATRAALVVYMRAFPELAALRGDPRFQRLADGIAPAASAG